VEENLAYVRFCGRKITASPPLLTCKSDEVPEPEVPFPVYIRTYDVSGTPVFYSQAAALPLHIAHLNMSSNQVCSVRTSSFQHF
jgi:hypothetical protein